MSAILCHLYRGIQIAYICIPRYVCVLEILDNVLFQTLNVDSAFCNWINIITFDGFQSLESAEWRCKGLWKTF